MEEIIFESKEVNTKIVDDLHAKITTNKKLDLYQYVIIKDCQDGSTLWGWVEKNIKKNIYLIYVELSEV